MATPTVDYYEFLQISPNADAETIHRVYRFLAARLHPDNAETGHEENFRLLKTAYDVLSEPRLRSEYDAARTRAKAAPEPLATTIDFMDSMEGELNRRLAVLAVLYYRRRTNPGYPEVPLGEIELRMGFPRDYLDFTLWYLQRKGYVTKADNAHYTLTVEGVDFVETERANMPTLHKLLTSGSGSSVEDLSRAQYKEGAVETEPISAPTEPPPVTPRPTFARPARFQPRQADQSRQPDQARQPARASTPIILPASMSPIEDRRRGRPDRRVGKPDLRDKKVERRFHLLDRREKIVTPQPAATPLLANGDS
jgi:curved DNA-binding protein